MAKRDGRTPAERAAWKAGEFTEQEAAEMGMTAKEANRLRAQAERELGNPLAPDEASR